MLLIAHRGNITGPNNQENHPDYLLNAIEVGYDVECDVWFVDNQLYLGHDEPTYAIDNYFLRNDHFWCHAKNIPALLYMLDENIHCFFHDTDDVTLTSQGWIWTYPGKEITNKSVCVLPERANYSIIECYGICSDYLERYNESSRLLVG